MIGNCREVLADSIAYFSRRVAQTRARKLSQVLFRYYPTKAGKTIIHDFDGNLSIHLDRASYISSAIYWAGHHCQPLIRFLRSFLRPEMTLVDVGANIGEVSLCAAKRLTRGRVLAFEPMPSLFAELSRNVALNHFSSNRIQLFNFGLYHETADLPLYVKEDRPYGTQNEGVSSLYCTGSERKLPLAWLRRFDDVARECSLTRLDLMKIDVEGAEWMVLRGAEESLRRFRPTLVLELSATNFRRAGYDPQDLISYLCAMEYDVCDLETGGKQLGKECDALCLPRKSQQIS